MSELERFILWFVFGWTVLSDLIKLVVSHVN
jgi:hypothetical protein